MRFIVISMDHDEQQTFIDFVDADSAESAVEQVLDERDYCCHASAFTPEELRHIADTAASPLVTATIDLQRLLDDEQE